MYPTAGEVPAFTTAFQLSVIVDAVELTNEGADGAAGSSREFPPGVNEGDPRADKNNSQSPKIDK